MSLRPYQKEVKGRIYSAWSCGARNVLAVLPTGAGKTVLFSDIIHDHNGASCAIAHRQELVSQISLALARDKVQHRIIGPKNVIKLCVGVQMEELGHSYFDPNARCGVAGVDTLVRRGSELHNWMQSVSLWVGDEHHHFLKDNKWGKAVAMFPNAKGLGVTATPIRADGKGLGRHADGLVDEMIVGPGMRELIGMGYLTDYRIFAPPSDLDLTNVTVSKATGDFNPDKLKKAVRQSHVIGDVVTHYLKFARGKLGITFATDVETAHDIAQKFNDNGVPAIAVSAKTPDADRIKIIRKFKNREYLQLVNVDLFGEGFDLPAVEVISMARPTASYSLFVQQFGRALRLMVDVKNWDSLTNEQRLWHINDSSKSSALIIDHVGNVVRHGLPDAYREWSLDRRDKRKSSKDDSIPVRVCSKCTAVYERVYSKCPYCEYKEIPGGRGSPEQVDGDLMELDASTLALMRGNIEQIDMDPSLYRAQLADKYVPQIGQMSLVKKHVEAQEAQKALRQLISWWAGYKRHDGMVDSEIYKRFYFKFGIDIMGAQALKTKDALALANRITKSIWG